MSSRSNDLGTSVYHKVADLDCQSADWAMEAQDFDPSEIEPVIPITGIQIIVIREANLKDSINVKHEEWSLKAERITMMHIEAKNCYRTEGF